jgi:hypothetical protein
MKRSTYSLAAVFLVVAIVAISAASLRGLWVRIEGGQTSGGYEAVVVAALGGGLFGFVLAVWTRTDFVFHPRNMARMGLLSMFGVVLGAAVGAQASAQVSGIVILLMPPLMIGCAALVAYNRRRRERRPAARNRKSNRPHLVHPLDRIDAEPLDDLLPIDDDVADSRRPGTPRGA